MELKELAEKTVYFASIGAVLQGGLRYAYEKRSGGLAEEGKQLQQSRRGLAEAYRNRLMRVAHSSLQGVGRFGGISALYFGAEFLAAVFRDCRDYYNSTIGGLVAGSFVGASCASYHFFSLPGCWPCCCPFFLFLGSCMGESIKVHLRCPLYE